MSDSKSNSTSKRIVLLLVILNVVMFIATIGLSKSNFGTDSITSFLTADEEEIKREPYKAPKLTFEKNPFAILGAYPDPEAYINGSKYDTPQYGLFNDDDYCDRVDLYNLANPENMFEKMNFFTDVKQDNMLRSKVLGRIGTLFNTNIDKTMPKAQSRTRTYHLDKKITTFVIATYLFHQYHQIGKHFLCATQISNHVPNQTAIIKKGQILQTINDYSLRYKDNPECFNKNTFYPQSYRLFVENECKRFFGIINSVEYLDSLDTEPIQYVIKIGRDAHKGQGVFLLDSAETVTLNEKYGNGDFCGQVPDFDIAQKYITNPLLLDKNNKFHMRVYMLIASSNPLIVYYQDGYIRASINSYNKYSEERESHLTNLMVDDLNQAIKENRTINGMTPEELDAYQIWMLEDLQEYLLETGKITDKDWLNTYLRPAFKKAFIHLARMVGGFLWKQSNVYELLGCDFMLDDNLGVWFLEANSMPQVDGVKDDLITKMLEDLFEIEYGYYRSRMKRVIELLHKIQQIDDQDELNKYDWRNLYQKAMKNRFEPEFNIKKTNSFKKIVDNSLPGAQAYFGLLSEDCANIH